MWNSPSKPAPLVSRGALARCALCLWGRGAALELPSRVRRAALTVGGPYAKRRHWAGEMLLSFVARPWCNVSAAASDAKPVPRVLRSIGALCSLSLTTRRITKLAGRARQVTLVVVDLGSTRGHCAGKRPLSSIARPWCNAPVSFEETPTKLFEFDFDFQGFLPNGFVERLIVLIVGFWPDHKPELMHWGATLQMGKSYPFHLVNLRAKHRSYVSSTGTLFWCH